MHAMELEVDHDDLSRTSTAVLILNFSLDRNLFNIKILRDPAFFFSDDSEILQMHAYICMPFFTFPWV